MNYSPINLDYFKELVLTLKSSIKLCLQKNPKIWNNVITLKSRIKQFTDLSYYFYDIANTFKSMYWPKSQINISTLSAELVFQYHKIEKGLVMPGPRRFFGISPVKETMRLLTQWQTLSEEDEIVDPIYLAGIGTLQSYIDHIDKYSLDQDDQISSIVKHFLVTIEDYREQYPTPSIKADYYNPTEFQSLSLARRSVRNYLAKPVPNQIIIDSFKVAQLAPSACNRQPCSVKIITDPKLKNELLSYQNGNRGFGHLAPAIAIITSKENYFFGTIERHQPYIDGGLFSMSFILGLQSHGVSSCCLNWCVTPEKDKAVHEILKLDKSERIMMYLAIGYAEEDTFVATSTRRATENTLDFI